MGERSRGQDAAPRASGRMPDAPIAASPVPIAWVLLQTAPKLRVLAVCADRHRLSREMADLVRIWADDARTDVSRAFAIRPANTLIV